MTRPDITPGRPLSVVVLGNSKTVLSVPGRSGPDDGVYAEVMRDRLVAKGIPTRVHLEGRWFDFATQALERYEASVRTHLPDVVVLQFGFNEGQPWLLPVPVVRHFVTRHEVTTRSGAWYRERVAPIVWRGVRGYRRWASARVGTRTWQTTPHRFHESLRQLIRAVRYESRALVLVLDLEQPGEMLEHFLPGTAARHQVVQDTLRQVVEGFGDPDVRLVRVSELIADEGQQAMPDEMHYAPLGHRVVGERLADEVHQWMSEGPTT